MYCTTTNHRSLSNSWGQFFFNSKGGDYSRDGDYLRAAIISKIQKDAEYSNEHNAEVIGKWTLRK